MEPLAAISSVSFIVTLVSFTSRIIKDLPKALRSRTAGDFSRGTKNYTVPSRVGSQYVDAVPDTGAQDNFISPHLAEKFGVITHKDTKRTIQLPGKKRVTSLGTVQVPFSFAGESERHRLDCLVLPGCTNDLILSGAFLATTGTLTTFRNRIKESLRRTKPPFRLNLLGNEKNRLWGLLNGQAALALPDTGSDVMLVSAEWAKTNKLIIDRGLEHQLELELADGSTVFTTGVVNTQWTFGYLELEVSCDFYVLDDLSVDVVLSNDFIFELDVFSRFSHLMVNLDSLPDLTEFYNIKLIGQYSPELSRLEGLSMADLNSPNAFSPAAIKAERVRRDQIRDAINSLPLSQQDEARRGENNRQQIWNWYREKHRQTETSEASTNGQNLPTQRTRWWELRPQRARIMSGRRSS